MTGMKKSGYSLVKGNNRKPNVMTVNIPNAGQPVSSQSKNTHQQDQHSRSILNVVVQFTGDSTQTEEPDHLE